MKTKKPRKALSCGKLYQQPRKFRQGGTRGGLTYWLGVVAIGLVAGLSLQFVQAWTEPSSAPPAGNVGAPLNTSNIGQSKAGGLLLNTGGAPASLYLQGDPILTTTGLIVEYGNVGIGKIDPDTKLDVTDTFTINSANDGTVVFQASAQPTSNSSASITAVYNQAFAEAGVNDIWGDVSGAKNQAFQQQKGDTSLMVGSYNEIFNQLDWSGASSNITTAYGAIGEVINENAGTITYASGFATGVDNLGTGTINEYNGLLIGKPRNDGGGTIETLNGIYISDLNIDDETGNPVVGINNIRAILFDHPTSPFVLTGDGNVGIGTTDPQSFKLYVAGKARADTPLASDSNDTVATKGYVDAQSGGGGCYTKITTSTSSSADIECTSYPSYPSCAAGFSQTDTFQYQEGTGKPSSGFNTRVCASAAVCCQ